MNATPQRVLKGKRDEDHAYPIDEWLSGLRDTRTRARILHRVDRLERGSFGDSKEVGMGVYELRLDFGPGYRVYFGRHGGFLVVLLGGGDKSTQTADIRKAQRLWREMEEAGIHEADLPSWREETA